MTKRGKPTVLTASDYLVRNQNGHDDQIGSARWQFVEAVSRAVPAFLERLRDQVYPQYASLAEINPKYWVTGSRFETWQMRSDPDKQLTSVLMAWAQEFNVQGADWILEGALQTLSNWRQLPRLRADLDISGFRQWNAIVGIVSAKDREFMFSDGGWDPTSESLASWRTNVRTRFEAAIDVHEKRLHKLVVERGAMPAVDRFTTEHFEWLALYHCGNLSLDSILRRVPHVGDKTTISKGLYTAASLAAITVRSKPRKRKTNRSTLVKSARQSGKVRRPGRV